MQFFQLLKDSTLKYSLTRCLRLFTLLAYNNDYVVFGKKQRRSICQLTQVTSYNTTNQLWISIHYHLKQLIFFSSACIRRIMLLSSDAVRKLCNQGDFHTPPVFSNIVYNWVEVVLKYTVRIKCIFYKLTLLKSISIMIYVFMINDFYHEKKIKFIS